ncbi:glycosyltransferase family 4 protein [Sphingomonas sp. AP4-R1]|uniref:glycosyltransferase family 4 protein n=1 Tax=Sphingomonas sp. AP4-R1 TaxID=2735134 RepID=UPI001493B803|nr:glycosyltransferase family 4 protein [Sphingomonas sp. AP4-R1]QJU59811.1 glycosyltransferase family 4 protein [Sphingomonas sp. AP4-R1]
MKSRVHVVMMWKWAYAGSGIPWAAAELANGFRSTPLEPTFYIPFPDRGLPSGLRVQGGLPKLVRKLLGAKRVEDCARRRTERAVLRAIRKDGPGALIWLWPGASLEFLDRIRAAGATMVREMVNTHRIVAKAILDEEEARSGIASGHTISDAQVAEEFAELERCDLIVSPSAGVDASLIAAGIAPERIIRTSFGWDPASMAGAARKPLPGKGLKVIFVGTVGVRKGAHLALAAWRKAGIDGTFVVVGNIEPGMKPVAESYAADDIVFLPFTDDLVSVYRGADFMFFPTLEEGAPLVCYQAAGCGCPVITTEMGSARIIEHEEGGLIVDAHDEDGMVAALRRLAGDAALRQRLGDGAKRRAEAATWAHVAQERARLVAERLAQA